MKKKDNKNYCNVNDVDSNDNNDTENNNDNDNNVDNDMKIYKQNYDVIVLPEKNVKSSGIITIDSQLSAGNFQLRTPVN